MISSGIYRGDIFNTNDMTEYFINLTKSIRKHICEKQEKYTIVLGLYGPEEINGFEIFYDRISQQPNPGILPVQQRPVANLSSPLKFKQNKKYLSPASKINNYRNKKKNKINKLKIK